MDNFFEIIFLEEAFTFLSSIDKNHYEKILYNIRKTQVRHDAALFKKLTDEIWEFRTLYQGLQYRLLAFWDKGNPEMTLVISTHGFVKKQSKVPNNELFRAMQLRKKYLDDKEKSKKKNK